MTSPDDGARDGGDQLGTREAHKRQTRAAIRRAADTLIAQQGFEATTVRQIAEAANVTERTFYRYFDGKEGLVIADANAWIESVQQAILSRPEPEQPLEAVRAALLELAGRVDDGAAAPIAGLLTDAPSALKLMRRSGMRPLLRIEEMISAAVSERERARTGQLPERFTADLVARLAVAVLRTVTSERRRARLEERELPPAKQLIERAFAQLHEITH